MSEVAIFPNLSDSDKFIKELEDKIAKVKNGNSIYRTLLSSIVFRDIMQHFKDEEGSDGPWEEWSDMYSDHMMKHGGGLGRILQNTGRLRNSVTPGKVRNVPGGYLWYNNAVTAKKFEKTTKTTTVFGKTISKKTIKTQKSGGFPYAYAHNEGGPKLPKRDFMWLSEEAMDSISEQTLAFILDEKI